MSSEKLNDKEYLFSLLTEHKQKRIMEVLAFRTRFITVVLEETQKSRNASAILRSCDVFGIQTVHVISSLPAFKASHPVAKGSNQWVTVNHYTDAESCIAELKKQHYHVVATTPYERGMPLDKFVMSQKIALVFGTEMQGISSGVMHAADAFLTIPMFGFTESLNISASVALCLYHLTMQLHVSSLEWQLSTAEKDALLLQWTKRILNIPQ